MEREVKEVEGRQIKVDHSTVLSGQGYQGRVGVDAKETDPKFAGDSRMGDASAVVSLDTADGVVLEWKEGWVEGRSRRESVTYHALSRVGDAYLSLKR